VAVDQLRDVGGVEVLLVVTDSVLYASGVLQETVATVVAVIPVGGATPQLYDLPDRFPERILVRNFLGSNCVATLISQMARGG
jgi:hypothetical protein